MFMLKEFHEHLKKVSWLFGLLWFPSTFKVGALTQFWEMSYREIISPYNINTISTRQVMRIKKNINKLIQYQILQTDIKRIA